MTIDQSNHTTTPWPAEGAVLMYVPGDSNAARRTANYARARVCVEACQPFARPGEALRVLASAAAVAFAVLPQGELQRELQGVLDELQSALGAQRAPA